MKKAFIFPGQGSQTLGMGKEFYDNFKIAKEVFNEVNEATNKDLTAIIFGDDEKLLTQTENAQPAIMCVSMAILSVLIQESGKSIEELCEFVAGHSLGEYSALCASEAFSLFDAAKLLKTRGEAFAKAGKVNDGSMLALIGATIEEAEEVAKKASDDGLICQVANDNTTGQIVLSGHSEAIEKAIKIAEEMKIKRAIKLAVSGAFHSILMESAVEEMKTILDTININEPIIPVITNVTVGQVFSAEEIKETLLKQITGRVRWREIMLNLEREGIQTMVEIGNGKILSGMINKTCPNVKSFSINSLESIKEFLKEI
jgi:[acyl-carrier-protein] S-malonyltransferase